MLRYYKLINENTIIGVATQNDFRTFQQKHKIILACEEEQAQFVQFGDDFYHAGWMIPVNTENVPYEQVDVVRIDKDEYKILYESIKKGEDIQVEQAPYDNKDNQPYVEPSEAITIDYVKTAKIAEMNYYCNKAIEGGVDVLLGDGNVYHFSLTTQDQLNLITLQSMIAAGETSIPYHADGELCRYYSVEDISLVMDSATAHKTFHVTYFNSLKVYINALESIADISAVQYGADIPAEYQSDILKALYVSMAVISDE